MQILFFQPFDHVILTLVKNFFWLRLYSPNYLIGEIFKHKARIENKAKASDDEILDFLNRILQRIHFVNEELISIEHFIEAYHLCKEVDEKDVPYVALSLELNAELWTRDNVLKTHLRHKGFDDENQVE